MLLKREMKGFALAPLPAVLPFTLLFGIILLDQPDHSASVINAWMELVLASYGASLSVGVPVHLIHRQLRRRSLRSYLLTTTVMVLVAALGFELFRLLVLTSPEANPFGFKLATRAGLAATFVVEALALTGSWIFWRTAIDAPAERATGIGAALNR
ncbi:hypothetical protein Q5H91_15530 [Sphingomonas sp. KR1UV-12]|uniref:Uncharacterized protein n=1 Tax=Sphingomonas aurea TaxID=3063994 RepID=A0ABT9ENU7_9SPHN|nr:hypothetical protein [Sphingomonas sp. KR1UV-12]MDP1028634.1 hypothetical protein [Sphingomonas sp. KR1UV-12]